MTSLLTFYLKGEITQEQNFVKFKVPNTIFGLIPLGAKNESIPVNQLSVVGTEFKLNVRDLLVGLLIFFIGLSVLSQNFIGGFIFLLLGANSIIYAFETRLFVRTTSGGEKNIKFLIFEKSKSEMAESQINQLINSRMEDTNTRVHTDRIVEAINNK